MGGGGGGNVDFLSGTHSGGGKSGKFWANQTSARAAAAAQQLTGTLDTGTETFNLTGLYDPETKSYNLSAASSTFVFNITSSPTDASKTKASILLSNGDVIPLTVAYANVDKADAETKTKGTDKPGVPVEYQGKWASANTYNTAAAFDDAMTVLNPSWTPIAERQGYQADSFSAEIKQIMLFNTWQFGYGSLTSASIGGQLWPTPIAYKLDGTAYYEKYDAEFTGSGAGSTISIYPYKGDNVDMGDRDDHFARMATNMTTGFTGGNIAKAGSPVFTLTKQ